MKHGDDARRVWAEAFAAGLKPRSLMTGSEWADEYRYVAPGTTSRPGPWRTDMVPYLKEPLDVATDRTTEELCLMWSSQVGKALCVETPIPTPDGWTTMGALRVGDKVLDEFCDPCTVTFATGVMHDRPCFDVEFSDGAVIRADAEHRWAVNGYNLYDWSVVTTTQLRVGDWVPEVWHGDSANLVYPARPVVDIRPVESVPVRCIQVSSESHVFLAGRSMVPTHNSELLLNIMGYYVDQEPAPQLLLMPTVEAVEAFSKERIDPTFRHSPGLRGKLETPKEGRTNSRKSSDTIRMKHFPGGYIAMVGANSPTGLSSRPIRIVLGDEVDRMPMDTGEGSPLRLAKQRATNFHNKKLLWVSTPTKRGESNIELMWERSDKRFFNIPCRDCGTLSAWKWDQIRWDKDAQNNVIYESVRHVCPACDATIRGNGMPDVQLLREGAWIATDTSPGRIAGFHLSSLYSPWVTLSELVQEFVDAARARNRNGMQEFVNLKLGELFEESHDTLSQEGLHKRREYYDAEVPEEVLILTAGVDIQERYIAAEVVGWGKGRESWGIEYRIIPGDPTQPEVWDQLDEFLLKTRYTPSGVGLSVVCTCVDSGDQTTDVYRYTKPRESRRVYAIKGSGTVGRPFISKPTNNNRVGALLWTIGVNDGKSSLLTRLAVEDEGPGYCHFPRKGEAGYDGEYFKGLLSERWSRTIVNGKVQAGWRKIHERNEPLDCRVYATAAIEILNPDFDRLAQEDRRGDVYVQGGGRQRRRGVISRGVT